METNYAMTTVDELIRQLNSLPKNAHICISSANRSQDSTTIITHIEDSTSCGWWELRTREVETSSINWESSSVKSSVTGNNYNVLTNVSKLIDELKDYKEDFIYITEHHTSPMFIITGITQLPNNNNIYSFVIDDVFFDDVNWSKNSYYSR